MDCSNRADDDPAKIKRRSLPNVIESIVTGDGMAVFVKGQDVDLDYGALLATKKLLSDCDHRIVFLHANLDELYERCQRKSWWEEDIDRKVIPEWRINQIDMLKKLSDDFTITALDSGRGSNYEPVEFPPVVWY